MSLAQSTSDAPYEHDPLCKALFESLSPAIRDSFTDEQVTALVGALVKVSGRRHRLDLRAEISLFFARYYIVLLAGPDRRNRVLRSLADRRQRGLHAGTGAALGGLFFMALSTLTVAAAIVLYLMKSVAGIDLLPDTHLWDLLLGWSREHAQAAMQIATSAPENPPFSRR